MILMSSLSPCTIAVRVYNKQNKPSEGDFGDVGRTNKLGSGDADAHWGLAGKL